MAALTDGTAPGEPDRNAPNLIVALALLTLVGAGLGGGFGFVVLGPKPETKPTATDAKAPVAAETPRFRFPADASEVVMAPIVTTIGPEERHRMRLECSVIMTKEASNVATLKSELAEDIIAHLRGLSIQDVSGAHGFQNLRDDLDEVVRIRGRGTVLGILISGFVVE